MELDVAVVHVQTVFATRNEKRNVRESCDNITCSLTKSCLLKNLLIKHFSWCNFIFRIFSNFGLFVLDLIIFFVSSQSSFLIFFRFLDFVFSLNLLFVVLKYFPVNVWYEESDFTQDVSSTTIKVAKIIWLIYKKRVFTYLLLPSFSC